MAEIMYGWVIRSYKPSEKPVAVEDIVILEEIVEPKPGRLANHR